MGGNKKKLGITKQNKTKPKKIERSRAFLSSRIQKTALVEKAKGKRQSIKIIKKNKKKKKKKRKKKVVFREAEVSRMGA